MSLPEVRKVVVETQLQIEQYLKDGYNVLLPSQTLQKLGEFYDISWEVVKLSIDDDAYPQDHWDRSKAKEFSLSKTGLLKLSHGAGIVWDPVQTRRIDPMTDRNYIAYRAVAALQRSDGRWIPFPGNADMDFEVEEADLRQLYTNKAKYLKKGRDQNEREATAAEKQEYIDGMVKSELLRKRKYKLPLVETKAMNRVIRGLLAIKPVYKKAELEARFAVPRIIFSPDLSDPEIRRAMLVSGLKGMEQAYGAPASLNIEGIKPIEIAGHAEDDPESQTCGQRGDETNGKSETNGHGPTGEPPAGASQDLPFDMPKEAAIASVEDFRKLQGEPAVKAIKELMKRKGYQESMLKNADIGQWTIINQEKFTVMLLSLKDKA